MSGDCNRSCVLVSPRDSRISCVFQTADEKDDVPAVGEESVLEMLSCSKFSDLETWLCMPSSMLLPRLLDSTRTSSSSSSNCRQSTCSDADTPDRSPEREAAFLTPALGKETPFLATPLLPILSSTPAAVALMSPGDSASRGGVSIRKRRRLAASPGGLHWKSAVSVQRDFWSADPGVGVEEGGAGEPAKPRLPARGGGASQAWVGHRAAVRKTVSVDDQLLQPAGREQRHLKLLSRLERGRKKLRNVHVSPHPTA
ncbi:ankyrin repeat and fibronectin type-III domain-containing protein 1-like [Nerophis lumbriciformis]|uniref:ankyrin repeat and fibronectin type-III domain-containing protein 1-like n=1 Tax=Nerophis lumbriciformis TaxID=546530 RepID=UPI002AE0ABE6|nr:ankyrin repeat and fibronectin type-III domain-containing protein 1-like [Nerophis lumbriciformis]XP_061782619.1 ankyrin repeat and fibronectin type-III domain-containing protein 1-like [Nerophis lumbriciformis]